MISLSSNFEFESYLGQSYTYFVEIKENCLSVSIRNMELIFSTNNFLHYFGWEYKERSLMAFLCESVLLKQSENLYLFLYLNLFDNVESHYFNFFEEIEQAFYMMDKGIVVFYCLSESFILVLNSECELSYYFKRKEEKGKTMLEILDEYGVLDGKAKFKKKKVKYLEI